MININVYTACRLDKQLKEMEQKHHIGSSWNPSDRIYLDMKSTFTKDRNDKLLRPCGQHQAGGSSCCE